MHACTICWFFVSFSTVMRGDWNAMGLGLLRNTSIQDEILTKEEKKSNFLVDDSETVEALL